METIEIPKITVLKVNADYDAILPKLSNEEYEALKESIKSEGQHYKIVVNSEGTILDGHNRWKICKELGIEPKWEIKQFVLPLIEKKFVIESNLRRRQLNDFQKAELAKPLVPIEEELSARTQVSKSQKGKKGFQPVLPSNEGSIDRHEREATAKVAKTVGLSTATFDRALYVSEHGDEETKQRLRNNDLSIGGAYKKIKQEEKRSEHLEELSKIQGNLPENVTLLLGDFVEKSKEIPASSVQLILTDPPYGEDFLDKWDSLAEVAERLLVPSGYLITYSGQIHLPTVIAKLCTKLEYFWTVCLELKERNLVNSRSVYNKWKPLLIFYKPPLLLQSDYLEDLIVGTGKEKEYHDWQQSEAEISGLIELFCPPNGVVLDPLAGAGTTLKVASTLNRKCIGIEINPTTFENMKRRLSNTD